MANFEVATREKYRFPFKGVISVEDLWDLGMNDLNVVFKTLNRGKKASEEESLLDDAPRTKDDEKLENMIEIVRYIADVKKDEARARREAAAKHARNERIKELIAKKQDESLANLPLEELQKLLEE